MKTLSSKNLLIIGAMVFMLFYGIAIGRGLNTNDSANNEANTINAADENVIVGNQTDDGLIKVTRVIDGDTIEIEGGEMVRYIGIDTPETVDPRKPVQCFGIEASAKNKELVEGKMVRLEKDITDKDKYNRLLRYVWVDDTLINLELVKQGFAYSYSYPPDVKYQDQIVKAQQGARLTKLGLWNICSK